MERIAFGVLLGVVLGSAYAEVSGPNIASLRTGTPIDESAAAPRMQQAEDLDVRRQRNYPMQPPTIPHKIEAYQVDMNVNKCMTCHSRRRIERSQAPMVSVTHYMDRDGNFLAEVSPRRYFCGQCHVVQIGENPVVDNTYEDVDAIIEAKKRAQE